MVINFIFRRDYCLLLRCQLSPSKSVALEAAATDKLGKSFPGGHIGIINIQVGKWVGRRYVQVCQTNEIATQTKVSIITLANYDISR